MVASWVSSTPGRPSEAPVEVGRSRGVVVVEPAGLRLERAREGGGELAGHGLDAAADSSTRRGDPGGVGVLADELAQGREPVGALASEGDGELLALVQAVGQGAASLGGGVVVGQRGRG